MFFEISSYAAAAKSLHYSPWGCKESDMTEQLSLALLFKGDISKEKACRTIRGGVSA